MYCMNEGSIFIRLPMRLLLVCYRREKRIKNKNKEWIPMSKALSFTAIFQGNSLNYGESIGNISELKKFHRANGEVYTFASRQSLRYDVVRLGNELFQWNLYVVDDKARRGVVQFKKNATIEDSGEMDLFGYLKTSKESQKR